jgi:MFS superfamily sulfate permease-like transporter
VAVTQGEIPSADRDVSSGSPCSACCLVICRLDAPLFFANAKTFRDEARRLANTELKPRWIVIAAEPVTGVVTTASDVVAVLVVAHAEDENGVTSKAIGDQMIVEDEAIVS